MVLHLCTSSRALSVLFLPFYPIPAFRGRFLAGSIDIPPRVPLVPFFDSGLILHIITIASESFSSCISGPRERLGVLLVSDTVLFQLLYFGTDGVLFTQKQGKPHGTGSLLWFRTAKACTSEAMQVVKEENTITNYWSFSVCRGWQGVYALIRTE